MRAVTTAAPLARRWRLRMPKLDTRTAFLYLLPALLLMGAITFYPLIFQVYISFTEFGLPNTQPGGPPAEWVGLSNYQRIVEGRLGIPNFDFFRIIAFNLWWALSNVVIHVIVGVGIAILLNTQGLRFKGIYRALFILPVVIPPLIVATVWRNMFDRNNGAVNELLVLVGSLFKVPPEAFQIDWLRQVADPIPFLPLPLAYFALLAANTWLGWPLNSVVATGALQSIPRELYEAAEMDGAGPWQKFRNVTLIFLRPAMIPYAIYGFVVTFNLFYLTYFMSGGGPFGRTELLVTQAFRLVYEYRLYGIAAAFGVFMFFILLAITIFFNRLTKATASYDT
ncbi:MAG: sugar ABC transporter permease [Chloroflexota bacterium]|nr:sugar ABC transporter permease [Chloroflexota bacterium]